MRLERRHFDFIAETLRRQHNRIALSDYIAIGEEFVAALKTTNPNFSPDRFRAAAYLPSKS